MAQHRTRQDKITAQIRREQQYTLTDLKLDSPPIHLQSNHIPSSTEKLLLFSPRFILRDLMRTFLASAFVFGVLIGIWMYLQ